MSRDIVLKGTGIYIKVVNPEPIRQNGREHGDPIYSLKLILDDDNDWQAVDAALRAGVANKFGNQYQLETVQSPFHPADEYGFAGKFSVNITTGMQYPPQGVWGEDAVKMEPIMALQVLYNGIGLKVFCSTNGYTNNMGPGVKFYLSAVQVIDRNRPRLALGGTDAASVFKPVAGAPAQINPTAYSQPGNAPGAPAPTPVAQPGPAPAPGPVASGPSVGAPTPAATYPSSVAPGAPAAGPGPYPYQR